MTQLGPLTFFIVLALVLPGLIVAAAAVLLFPELHSRLPSDGVLIVGAVMFVSLVTAHLPFVFESLIFDRLWDYVFPNFNLRDRRSLMLRRSAIIAEIETFDIDHGHLDQTLGEFVLFNNTGFWLLVLAGSRIVIGSPNATITLLSALTFAGAASTLLFACPFFKKSYLDILEVLETTASVRRRLEDG